MSGDTMDDKGATKDTGTESKIDDKSAKDSGTGDGREAGAADLKTDDVSGLKKALQATRKERDDLVKAQRDAELAKLPELERAQTEALGLKAENEKLAKTNMRLTTALKLGLPWSVGKRLEGDTLEEMEADGAELVKTYKGQDDDKRAVKDDPKNKRPPNDAKRNGTAGGPGMNEILRALRRS